MDLEERPNYLLAPYNGDPISVLAIDAPEFAEYEFTGRVEGVGRFGEVYQLRKGEQVRALKLFYPAETRSTNREKIEDWQLLHEWMLGNLRQRQRAFSDPVFLKPTVIGTSADWYVMEYFKANDVRELLKRDVELSYADKMKFAQEYNHMLRSLHDKGLLFNDNNWGAMLYDGENIKICDLDFVAPAEEMREPSHFARRNANLRYASREHRLSYALRPAHTIPPFSVSSDLEAYALMLDHLFIGTPWIANRHDVEVSFERAKLNKRRYPAERKEKLPEHVRQVLPELINYPRNNDVGLDDIVDALRDDY